MYAVKSKLSPALVFFSDDPGPSPILDTDSAERDVEIDVPPNVYDWAEGLPWPEQALGRSETNPKIFKLFRHGDEMKGTEYRPVGLNFGGIFSLTTWKRFEPAILSNAGFQDVLAESRG